MTATRCRWHPHTVLDEEAQLSAEQHWLPEILDKGARIAPPLAHPETYHHRMDVTRARQRLEEERTETFERERELTNLTIVEGELRDIDDALLEAKHWARFCIADQVRADYALSHH